MLKKSDILLIGIVSIAAVLCFAGFKLYQSSNKGKHITAVIIHDNQVIERINLDTVTEPRELTISGNYHNKIYVEPGRIRFEKSDCPDQICVNTGWLTKYGDIAVCMPNKALITIEKE